MQYPLRIELRASRRMIWLNAAIHLVAALSFLQSAFHPAVLVVAWAVLAWSFRHGVRREEAKGLAALTLGDDGALHVESVDGEVRGRALGSSVDFGWALWLHWEGRERRRGALMLLPDNLGETGWRGLRIWMRHKSFRPESGTSG